MGWIRRLLVVSVLVLIAGVAGAEPSAPEFVPVAIGSGPTEVTVVVMPGDHLWKISQTHLDATLGRRADVGEVAPYWSKLIEQNRHNLRSGDPDLIYPGEVVVLPSVP